VKYDYVVIGAGISGISTAIILAKNDYKVALVEKSKKTAPVLRGFMRKEVFFDTGFHYTGGLGNGEILETFFQYMGVADGLKKEPYNEQCFDLFRCLNPRFDFCFPCGYDRIREKFLATFPRDKDAVDKYLRSVKDVYYSFPYINLDADMDSAEAFESVHGPSLKEFLDRLTDNRLLKCVLSIHCLLHGVPPEETSFINHACVVGPLYESAHGINGGGLSLVKAFDRQLEKLEVDVYCGRGVREILISSDRTLSGVRLEDGETLDSIGCVSTLHPHRFLSLVPHSLFRPAYIKRLKRLEETSSAYVLYAVCNSTLKYLAGTNIFVSSGMDLTGFRKDTPVEELPLFITSAGQSNERSEEHGFIVICPTSITQTDCWSYSITGKRPKDYALFKERITEKLLQHIEISCPELAGEITHVESATPLTLRDFANSPFGSLYGVKHQVGQYNPSPLTRVKGLFLAGQAISAPGILGSIVSGFLACGNIIGHNRLRKELRKWR